MSGHLLKVQESSLPNAKTDLCWSLHLYRASAASFHEPLMGSGSVEVWTPSMILCCKHHGNEPDDLTKGCKQQQRWRLSNWVRNVSLNRPFRSPKLIETSLLGDPNRCIISEEWTTDGLDGVTETDRSRTQMSKYCIDSAKTHWMTKKYGLQQNVRSICGCLCVSLNPL